MKPIENQSAKAENSKLDDSRYWNGATVAPCHAQPTNPVLKHFIF